MLNWFPSAQFCTIGKMAFLFAPREIAAKRLSLFHELSHGRLAGIRSIDDAFFVNCDSFRGTDGLIHLGNKGRDLPVFDAADPDALLEGRIRLVVRSRVSDIDHVVFVDGNVAWPAELFPFRNEFAFR